MHNKSLTYGNVDMLVLKLIEKDDMYGYQIIEQLEKQSNNVFQLSAGSLYPLLHNLESKGYVVTYDAPASDKTPGKPRKYYQITKLGKEYLCEKASEWEKYSNAIDNILCTGRRVAI